MIRYATCIVAAVVIPLTGALAQPASLAALKADLAAGRAETLNRTTDWFTKPSQQAYVGVERQLPKGKLHLTGLFCYLRGPKPAAAGTVTVKGPFKAEKFSQTTIPAGPMRVAHDRYYSPGYGDRPGFESQIVNHSFSEPMYYDNSSGKEEIDFGFSPSLYQQNAELNCTYSVVRYLDSNPPTTNPAVGNSPLRTINLKVKRYDNTDDLSSGQTDLPAGQYFIRNVFCRGSGSRSGSAWLWAGDEGVGYIDLGRLALGADRSIQLGQNISGLFFVRSQGGRKPTSLGIALPGAVTNGECSVSLEQYTAK